MDIGIITAFIGLGGISLGALLSGIGYFWKIRAEKLKTKKTVLYYLLEIRFFVKSEFVDPDEISQSYFDYCDDFFKRKGITAPPIIRESIKNVVKSHIKDAVEAARPNLDLDFINSYEKSVTLLSSEYPILAYRLKGRKSISRIIAVQREYLSNTQPLEDAGSPELVIGAAKKQFLSLNCKILEDILKEIDGEIKHLSWHCGLLTRYGVRHILKDNSKQKINVDDPELENALTECLAVIIEAYNTSKQQETSPA